MRQVASMVRLPPPSMFWGVEGERIDAAGGGAAAGRKGEVVSAGETGDPIQEDDDVAPALNEPLRPLDARLGYASLVLNRIVEGGSHALRFLYRATPVRDFLRPLSDEEDDDVDVLISFCDRLGDHLEDYRLPCLGGGDYETSLAAPDGGDEGDYASGEVAVAGLQG